jgi:circadian clock protein KaiC
MNPLVSTGVPALDRLLGGGGYPDKSAILIVGPPGIAKEALGYWFTNSGLNEGDFCLYITRVSVSDVLRDQRVFGVEMQRAPFWMAGEGGGLKYDMNDLSGLSFRIKDLLKKNDSRRIRITTDVLSSLLMLNPPETIYKFLAQLFSELKQYGTVFLATLEEGMHPNQVLIAMQQVFDGVVELKLYQEGFRVYSLLQIVKMRGVATQPIFYNFTLSRNGMEIAEYAR